MWKLDKKIDIRAKKTKLNEDFGVDEYDATQKELDVKKYDTSYKDS